MHASLGHSARLVTTGLVQRIRSAAERGVRARSLPTLNEQRDSKVPAYSERGAQCEVDDVFGWVTCSRALA